MSLEQFQLLAFAAGFGAVSEDAIDIERTAPLDDVILSARTGREFGRNVPDAPAPRSVSTDRTRALTVVAPLWRTPATAPVSNSWSQHLASVARSMSAYLPGRGVPA